MPETSFSDEVEQTYQELMAELKAAKENSKKINPSQQEVDSSTHKCIVNGVCYEMVKTCRTPKENSDYLDSLLKKIDERENAKLKV